MRLESEKTFKKLESPEKNQENALKLKKRKAGCIKPAILNARPSVG